MTPDTRPVIGCRDSCGREVRGFEEDALLVGWHYLDITKNWRCPDCTRALGAAQNIVGTEGGYAPDPLPPTSRGALAKETASSIYPPVVKP